MSDAGFNLLHRFPFITQGPTWINFDAEDPARSGFQFIFKYSGNRRGGDMKGVCGFKCASFITLEAACSAGAETSRIATKINTTILSCAWDFLLFLCLLSSFGFSG